MRLPTDLKVTLRSLVRSPVFTLVAVGTLAVAIGANTAIFTLVNAALLRPLPYRSPDQLLHFHETRTWAPALEEREASFPNYQDFAAQNRTLAGLAGYNTSTVM